MAHMHYKGTGKVHSFRGLLADGDQRKIRIQGSVGAIAWRITKFQVLAVDGDTNTDPTVKIYREKQSSIVSTVDFTEDELLAAALLNEHESSAYQPTPIVIFDNALFVRNIYISQKGASYSLAVNYYIELEEVKVSAAGMAQLAVAAARRREER